MGGSGREEISRRKPQRKFPFLDGQCGVAEGLGDISGLENWVFGEDLVNRHPIGDHRDNRSYRKSQTTDARNSPHLAGIYRDAFKGHTFIIEQLTDTEPIDSLEYPRRSGGQSSSTGVQTSSPASSPDDEGAVLGATFGLSLAPSSRFAAPGRPQEPLDCWVEVSERLVLCTRGPPPPSKTATAVQLRSSGLVWCCRCPA